VISARDIMAYSISQGIDRAADAVLDLVYPRHCEACGGTADIAGRYLCWECLAGIPVITDPYCALCGDPVDGNVYRRYVCSTCNDRTPKYDLARSAVRFRGPVKDLVHRLKYSSAMHLGGTLCDIMVPCFKANYGAVPVDAVTCVPMFARKERERTYNQAEMIAGELAKRICLPFCGGLIRKLKDTGTQTRFNAAQRRKNIRDSFDVTQPEWCSGRRFLLVDDVMTTGSTVDEVSGLLKESGAVTVHVLTLARG
jgi:ComF family protein